MLPKASKLLPTRKASLSLSFLIHEIDAKKVCSE